MQVSAPESGVTPDELENFAVQVAFQQFLPFGASDGRGGSCDHGFVGEQEVNFLSGYKVLMLRPLSEVEQLDEMHGPVQAYADPLLRKNAASTRLSSIGLRK